MSESDKSIEEARQMVMDFVNDPMFALLPYESLTFLTDEQKDRLDYIKETVEENMRWYAACTSDDITALVKKADKAYRRK